MATHHHKAGESVTIFQMHPSKGLQIEGRAAIVKTVKDVDEYYMVRFENELGETYQRFVDWQGQESPSTYVREFNRKIGK